MQENNRDFSVFKKRILQYLDCKGASKYECYQKTGIANGVLSQTNGMSEDNMLKFLSYYSDINPDWLLNGILPMLRKTNCTSNNTIDSPEAFQSTDSENKYSKKNENVQENTIIIDKLLARLENQSKEIGRLESEISYLHEQLAEKNIFLEDVVEDVVCAAAG
jgi:hypothetical protein